jgi:LemA protein
MNTTIALSIVIIIFIYFIITYNRFIRRRNMVHEAWSNVDVQLKRRYNLIPNLIEAVKGYMKHEKKILEDIAKIRNKAMSLNSVKDKSEFESTLSRNIKELFALAEAYPELKANQNFLDLQDELADTEEQIQMARRYFNGTVREFNILVESVPSNLVAKTFNFDPEDFLEIEDITEREVPEVKF